MTAAAVPTYLNFPAQFPDKFVEFHTKYPHIYTGICERARELKAAGFDGVGVRYCFEHQRYSRDPRSPVDDGFVYALNNNFAAFYARLISAQERDLTCFFRMRRMKDEINPPDKSQLAIDFD